MKFSQNLKKLGAFSLIEMMVAMGILSVLMLMLTVLLDQVQQSWRFAESRISQFREARVAFDLIAKNIGQASLNTYLDLRVDDDGEVEGYFRTSELHFVTLDRAAATLPRTTTQEPVGQAVFFQAPLGFSTRYRNLNNLFNGRGYFVSFGSDKLFRPSFVDTPDRYRYRLMEFRPPAESNQVFQDGQDERSAGLPQVFDQWYTQALSVGEGDFEEHLNPLAENIIALVVSPRDSLENPNASRGETFSKIAPNYGYDSNDEGDGGAGAGVGVLSDYSQQVPPLVRLTVVAIDETSAVRNDNGSSKPANIENAMQGLFVQTENYTNDIKTLSDRLNAEGSNVNHKVFSSLVMLRSAKWSGSN
jgi:uncharacterized protein (TIGR02599 family)